MITHPYVLFAILNVNIWFVKLDDLECCHVSVDKVCFVVLIRKI
jgi:hypothetical protein